MPQRRARRSDSRGNTPPGRALLIAKADPRRDDYLAAEIQEVNRLLTAATRDRSWTAIAGLLRHRWEIGREIRAEERERRAAERDLTVAPERLLTELIEVLRGLPADVRAQVTQAASLPLQ